MLVGRLNPVARTSFWKQFALATLTVTGTESVALPAASRARAVSVCGPFGTVRVSHVKAVGRARVLGPVGAAVDEELHAGDADVVVR